MWSNCEQWRKTVGGVGIDELYREIDPFDVRRWVRVIVKYTEVLAPSIQSGIRCSNAGLCGGTRCAQKLQIASRLAYIAASMIAD